MARKAWSFSASPIPTMLWGDSSSAARAAVRPVPLVTPPGSSMSAPLLNTSVRSTPVSWMAARAASAKGASVARIALPRSKRNAAAAQRLDQRGLGRIAERAQLAALREVDERAVLGDDRVEHPVDIRAHRPQVGQHAAGHQQQLAPGGPHALERLGGGLGDAVGVGDGPVVVGGEDVDVHGTRLFIHGNTHQQRRRRAAGTPRLSEQLGVDRGGAGHRRVERVVLADDRLTATGHGPRPVRIGQAVEDRRGQGGDVAGGHEAAGLARRGSARRCRPTSVATTGVPTASACGMTCEAASERIEGSTSTSRAAITSGMSRRKPVMRTASSRPSARVRRCTSSKPTPSPTIRKRAAGSAGEHRRARPRGTGRGPWSRGCWRRARPAARRPARARSRTPAPETPG